MKFLPESIFKQSIPRVSQKFYEWYLSFRRKPQVYSLKSSELTDGKYYFKMKALSPSTTSKKVSTKCEIADPWN